MDDGQDRRRRGARAWSVIPALELVGCYAYSPEKVGEDVGVLAGIEPIGILATDDVDALLALKPDCVSYMPFRPDFDHVVRILESGVNLVTTMYMLAGSRLRRRRARSGSKTLPTRGQSSLYASGIYPGHANMVALAGERDVDPNRPHLRARVPRYERVRERADVPCNGHRPGRSTTRRRPRS